ncbi:hypothetical protein UFOVP570_48 [uncultured Caudovirales phage]|uniref:Uncharacterized protein n=1 Tax=uncultured Caudovirales phage TaxID=2100421 RepID=A0A6J5MTN3_9CAUD|nr:hypothetical protein UFOVP570_48 [uncultured Caudovirales phage]
MSEAVKSIRYVGAGDFVVGYPAVGVIVVTEREADALIATGLYEEEKPIKAAPIVADAAKEGVK